MDALATLAGLTIGNIAGNLGVTAFQDKLNRQAEERAFERSQKAQVDAPGNYVAGLRKAGLPINLALKGAFQTATPSGPLPTQSHPIDFTGAVQAAQQASMMESQRNLVDEQVKGQEISNDIKEVELNRMQSEDKSVNESLRDYFSTMARIEPDKADFWNGRAQSVNDFDAGTLKAIRDFDDNIQHRSDVDLKVLDNKVLTAVKQSQLADDGVIKALAKMPQDSRIGLYKQFAKQDAEIERMASQNMRDESEISKANIEAKKILADIDHAYNSDLVANVRNGDYVGALLILGSTIAKEASAGAGAAAVGAATRNPSGVVAGYRNARARAQSRAQPFPR